MSDKRLAMMFRCPQCRAEPGEACWNDEGTEEVALHEERIAVLDSDEPSALSRYHEDGTVAGQ